MPRTAIISDIHGNLPALEAVINHANHLKCEEFIFLGDVCGYYSQINECIDLLKQYSKLSIMGNHDEYILNDTTCPRSNTANMCLDLQRTILSPSSYEWLSKLQKGVINYKNMSLTHAGWRVDPIDEYISVIEECYFDGLTGQFFMSGHTHVQSLIHYDHFTYCNPGSVGQPRDGNPAAAFAILDESEKLHLERVVYDISRTCEEMAKHGMPPAICECLHQGVRIDGNVTKIRIKD